MYPNLELGWEILCCVWSWFHLSEIDFYEDGVHMEAGTGSWHQVLGFGSVISSREEAGAEVGVLEFIQLSGIGDVKNSAEL